jgi:hypothetical protein
LLLLLLELLTEKGVAESATEAMLTLGGVSCRCGESGDGVAELAADGDDTLARPLLLLLPRGLLEPGRLNVETASVSLVSNDSSLWMGSALMSSTSISSAGEELLL